MAVLDAKTKLKAKVVKGNIIYKDNSLYSLAIGKFEGKDIIVTVEKNNLPPSKDLYAFYFGIIIRKECMQSDSFVGHFDEKELHEIFQYKLRRWTKIHIHPDGRKEIQERVDDVLQYDQEGFIEYLNDLKMYLETELGIIIKDYDEYIIHKMRLTR